MSAYGKRSFWVSHDSVVVTRFGHYVNSTCGQMAALVFGTFLLHLCSVGGSRHAAAIFVCVSVYSYRLVIFPAYIYIVFYRKVYFSIS